jgi:flagellar biosynthesis GTPase FlhF
LSVGHYNEENVMKAVLISTTLETAALIGGSAGADCQDTGDRPFTSRQDGGMRKFTLAVLSTTAITLGIAGIAATPVSAGWNPIKDVGRVLDDGRRAVEKAAEDARRAAEKAAEDARRATEKAAEDTRRAAEKAAEDARRATEKAAEDTRRAAEKAAEDARRAAEKAAEDTRRATEKAAEDTRRAAEKAAQDGGKTLEKAAQDTGKSIEQAVHDVGKAGETIYTFGVREIEAIGKSVDEASKRVGEGKFVDAMWHLSTDQLKHTENAGKAAQESNIRPPDLIDFSMTPNRRLSAVRCQETEFRWC